MIEIALLRVCPNSEYLEFSVNCPETYEFDTLTIIKYDVNTKAWEPYTHDASGLIASGSHELIMRIAMSVFSSDPTDVTMYKVTFGATEIEGTETLSATGICSNINFVYANLLDLVMALTNCCVTDEQYDVLNRNHMILYAHQEAMRLGRELEAKYFYDIIWNLFVSCGPTTRQLNIRNKPCNCDG